MPSSRELLVKNKPEDIGQVPDGPVSKRVQSEPGKDLHKNVYKTPVDFTAKEALRTPSLWLLTIYGTVQFFCINALMPHQIAFLFDLGISSQTAALAAGVLTAVMTITSLGIGILGLRFNMRILAMISILIGLAGFGTIMAAQVLSHGDCILRDSGDWIWCSGNCNGESYSQTISDGVNFPRSWDSQRRSRPSGRAWERRLRASFVMRPAATSRHFRFAWPCWFWVLCASCSQNPRCTRP